MRELKIEEVEQVSGGSIGEAAKYWSLAARVAQGVFGSGWASMAAVSALGSPLGLVAIVGLTFGGGYTLWRN